MERRNAALLEIEILLRTRPHTARGLAEKLGISKPTAYSRIAALSLRGRKIKMKQVREGLHGPKATAYSIAA